MAIAGRSAWTGVAWTTAVFVVAWVDRQTGGDVSFLALYALPVLLAALSSGLRHGLVASFAAAVAWAFARSPSGDPAGMVAWNVLNRASLFVTVAFLAELYRREARTAREDPLTALPNRRAIVERLGDALVRLEQGGGSFAVAMLDLDGFKAVNDQEGHEAGDAVLRSVAGALRGATRPGDLAGRIGGDEFILLLQRVQPDQVEALVRRFLQGITRSCGSPGGLAVGASAGALIVTSPPPSVDVVLREADLALREAKDLGRGRVVVRRSFADPRSREATGAPSVPPP